MQVNPQEVSGAKATTRGQRERFEAAYAAEYNQLRGTDITASDIAGMRDGNWYGDRAYLNGVWRGWQLAEVQPAAVCPKFLATVQEAKATAIDIFTGCHDDAKQAIEYLVALLETSDLAKQGGEV